MSGRRKPRTYLVLGLGYFGRSVAKTLADMGHEVVAADESASVVDNIKDCVAHAVQLDATDVEALRELDIPSFDRCVVGRGTDLEDSINIVMGLKELDARFIVAKAMTDRQAQILEKLGADHVVFPERDMGVRVAHSLQSPRVLDYMNLGWDFGIEEILAPPWCQGKSLAELELRQQYGLNVIALRRGTDLIVELSPESTIHERDLLVVAGTERSLEAFAET